jgi:hypothetical protein
MPSTSAILVGSGIPEVIRSMYVCEYVEVPLVWRWSSCSKIFTALRSAMSSSSSTLVRERNPHVRSMRVRLRTLVYHYSSTNR